MSQSGGKSGERGTGENRPRPRAFRLDDLHVAIADPAAPLLRAASVIIEPQAGPIPDDSRTAAIDEGEQEIEAAQKAGMLERWQVGSPGRCSGPGSAASFRWGSGYG